MELLSISTSSHVRAVLAAIAKPTQGRGRDVEMFIGTTRHR
jgi:hypothetical protein